MNGGSGALACTNSCTYLQPANRGSLGFCMGGSRAVLVGYMRVSAATGPPSIWSSLWTDRPVRVDVASQPAAQETAGGWCVLATSRTWAGVMPKLLRKAAPNAACPAKPASVAAGTNVAPVARAPVASAIRACCRHWRKLRPVLARNSRGSVRLDAPPSRPASPSAAGRPGWPAGPRLRAAGAGCAASAARAAGRWLGRSLSRHHGARRNWRVAPPSQLRQCHVFDLRPLPHRQRAGSAPRQASAPARGGFRS